MSTYNDKLAEYYDDLYLDKDYTKEAEYIANVANNHNILLDVGCGTMTHTILLSAKFEQVFAVDLSKSMIDVGISKLKKRNISNVLGLCCDVAELKIQEKADCAISMFNVVNHIETIVGLQEFFKAISNQLKPNAKFVFDCWNGVACTIDKPNENSFRTRKVNNKTYYIITSTQTNLFDSLSTMETTVSIKENNEVIDCFSYKLRHILWSNHVFKDLLKNSGFVLEAVSPNVMINTPATINDYRLVYTCRKIA